jgi:hypothetical protein
MISHLGRIQGGGGTRRIIGVMEKNLNSEKRVLSVGIHKIDFSLLRHVSKYQKVIKIADCIPETDSGFWFFFGYYNTISTTEAERMAKQSAENYLSIKK